MWEELPFNVLNGLTLVSVVNNDNEEIVFTTEDGRKFRQYHSSDCCEQVSVESVLGDFADLVGSPIVFADESSSDGGSGEWDDSSTWTFYRIGTVKGSVVIRWFGSSNGYYSESVTFEEVK